MPRMTGISPEQAPPEVREVFDGQMEAFGFHLNTTRVYAHVPSIMFAATALADAIQDAPHIAPEILAMVSVRTAQINGCPF